MASYWHLSLISSKFWAQYGSQDGLCFGWGLGSGSLGCVLNPEAWHGSRIGVPWLPERTLGSWPDPALLRNDPSHSHSLTSSPFEPSLQWGWVPMCAGPEGDDVKDWEWEGSLRERPWVVCPGKPFQREGSLKGEECAMWNTKGHLPIGSAKPRA